MSSVIAKHHCALISSMHDSNYNGLYPLMTIIVIAAQFCLADCVLLTCIINYTLIFNLIFFHYYYCSGCIWYMDFYEDEYVTKLCGSQDLLELVDLAFEGVNVEINNPLLPVSQLFYDYYA